MMQIVTSKKVGIYSDAIEALHCVRQLNIAECFNNHISILIFMLLCIQKGTPKKVIVNPIR